MVFRMEDSGAFEEEVGGVDVVDELYEIESNQLKNTTTERMENKTLQHALVEEQYADGILMIMMREFDMRSRN